MNLHFRAPAATWSIDRVPFRARFENALSGLGFGVNVGLLRLAAALFVLPNAIFASALGPAPAVGLLIGCLVSLVLLHRRPQKEGGLLAQPVDPALLAGCFALALALALLGGQGRFFYANHDWIFRDAVLADLLNHNMVNIYTYKNQEFFMRAPLGMYLAPAMVGRALGLVAAHYALLLQNTALLCIILYFLALIMPPRRRLAAILVFVGFSGLDILPALLFNAKHIWSEGRIAINQSLEMWIGAVWNEILVYPSHVGQFFWAPNHTLPGWWFATTLLLYLRREIDLAALVALFVPPVFWSPLAMMGALPFLALAGIEQGPLKLFAPRVLAAAAAGLAFLPVALYLTRDAGAVPHGFLLGVQGFLWAWPLFLIVEIPHAAIVVVQRRLLGARDRRMVAAAIGMLILIPTYTLGDDNDCSTRVSSVSLFLLAFAFARVAALTPRDGGAMATAISSIVIISAATPLFEIKRSFTPPSPISDCNFITAWNESLFPAATNYLARRETRPDWLAAPEGAPLAIEPRVCRPNDPYAPTPDDARR
jgi:hypothetical protein